VAYRAPLWVRALLAWDRVAVRAQNAREGLLDELALAWIRPEDRADLTAVIYAKQGTYLPGGAQFQGGLFAWERRALDAPPFPRAGRVLLGAAGAGRELVALIERGFSVVAFDPCAPFAEAARRLPSADHATIVQASYADLVDAAEGRPGPLDMLRSAPPFDAVVLGWGSFSHVMPRAARLALLRALRTFAPKAPVLLSFALSPGGTPKDKGRVRGALRRIFAATGAPGVSEVGDHFFANGGFFSFLTQDDILKLAWEAGYEVARFEEQPYAHAILVPHGVA